MLAPVRGFVGSGAAPPLSRPAPRTPAPSAVGATGPGQRLAGVGVGASSGVPFI